ncbi:MAG: excinuclease ABC subunit UvrA [Candidatus Kapabacteria bacterium]|nr:excinuclease ABC subunit UvrA [Candidatus Kapabacteria bacterium]
MAIRGARVNNLKNIDVDIPRNALTVITGLSGSGKSSLAFDTLYAEGQRRFVESLSAYARQFLDRMNKPDVDSISGLPPAVAIEQQAFAKNPRSTVGTTTEIYDHLRLLYGRIGIVIDKDTGEVVKKDSPQSVTAEILNCAEGSRLYIMYELPSQHAMVEIVKEGLSAKGFTRVLFGASTALIEVADLTELPTDDTPVYVLVDRIVVNRDNETVTRITDSVEQAFNGGSGRVLVRNLADGSDMHFSSLFESARTKTLYIEPEPRLFSFNSPFGACPTCQGFGRSVGVDLALVVPDKSLSIRRGALHPFRGETFGAHLKVLISEAPLEDIPLDAPFHALTAEQVSAVFTGFGKYIGVDGFFRMLEEKSYKTHYRVMLSRYRGYTTCVKCQGSRIRTAARQVFVHGKNIPHIVSLTLRDARDHFDKLTLTPHEEKIVGQILIEIRRRLHLLCEIGLEYLSLDRLSHTLSGGESQRINLATSLGSALVGTLYVLDEPSIGLHPRDTDRLLRILRKLRGLGNTVVIVEHDLDVIRTADHVIDIGPHAGEQGGEVVYSGSLGGLIESGTSLTADYLTGRRSVSVKTSYRKGSGSSLIVRKPIHHNLTGDDVSIPLGTMTVVTGVSGSGKSSLVHDVIYAGIQRMLGGYSGEVGHYERMEGLEHITGIEMIDQAPIGRSSRSTPATYTKIFDNIRDVYASTQVAKQLGWKPGYFSFNVAGGRCDVCEGAGTVTIEMQFLPDIELPCEVCNGTRYKRDAQHILYKSKSIIDVLGMTVEEAISHFEAYPRIVQKLTILRDVGLGYIRLGQPSTHLSGGEAQRIKLASHLDTQNNGSMLFVFDEPTTGLHVHDVSALMAAFDSLVDRGHTLIVIEHNVHVMAAADWIIDLGPEGGDRGGRVVATGTPKAVSLDKESHTGVALAEFYAESGMLSVKKKMTKSA